MKKLIKTLAAIFALASSLLAKTDKMNVVFVMTDDQGYGDLSYTGNPYLKTPHLDNLAEDSYRFTNYHGGTTCAPTRAGLMSSMYNNKVGVWHTIMGRSLMDRKYKTIANVFQDNGYATGIFGKWHLGDNYPYRPMDRGFETSLWFKSGGVTQISDYWGNIYYDDTYLDGETPVKTKGYCTDVFFDASMEFMKKSKEENRPFFVYLSLNASHGPHNVEDKYSERFKGMQGVPSAAFYGMVENVDYNFGRLEDFLAKNGLTDNTIVIYTTDNGTSGGYSAPVQKKKKNMTATKEATPAKKGKKAKASAVVESEFDENGYKPEKGYNAGMTGKKTSNFDGGHRLPFFMRVPNGKSVDIDQLFAYIDVAPTLFELCGLKADTKGLDGISIKSVIDNPKKSIDRYLVVDTQRAELMQKDKTYAVLKGNWRYLDGKALYDVTNDVGQKNNIIAKYPEVAKEMQAVYDSYWEYIAPENDIMHPIYLAAPNEECVVLSSHDRHISCLVGQASLRAPGKSKPEGYWYVTVPEDGVYTFELYRWPVYTGLGLKDSALAIPAIANFNGGNQKKGHAFTEISGGEIVIGDVSASKQISAEENPEAILLENVKLKKGEYKFFANIFLGDKDKMGANFVKITKK